MLELGVLIGGAAIGALLVLSRIFRQPVPPRWTRSGFVGEFVAVGLVAGFAIGTSLIVAGVVDLAQSGMTLMHALALIGAAGVLVAAWHWLQRRRHTGNPGSGRLPTGVA